MKIVLFIIFWVIGIVISLLGNKQIRDYKYYSNPRLTLFVGIFLAITMSWAMFMCQVQLGEYELPDKLYHSCEKHCVITFEEEYLDKDGNKTDYEHSVVHHTYKIYTCCKCGKEVRREQLQ